jgi:hypothetical protein
MTQASAEEVTAMDAAQAEVTRLLKAAEERAAVIEAKWGWKTDLEEASLLAIRNLRLQFNQWADSSQGMRRWALDGHVSPDNGGAGLSRPYTPQEWLDFGKELGELAAEEAKQVLTTSLFHLYSPPGALLRPVAQAAAELGVKVETTTRQAAEAAAAALAAMDPRKPWSLKTKLVVGGLATLTTLGLLAYVGTTLKPLASLLGGKDSAKP